MKINKQVQQLEDTKSVYKSQLYFYMIMHKLKMKLRNESHLHSIRNKSNKRKAKIYTPKTTKQC